jgi:hypothetical protein
MNPNFAQETTADQYLAYDSWLHQERVRNWSAYTAYCEYKQQQQATYARIQQLRYQYQQFQQQIQQQQIQQQQQQQLQQQQEQLQAEADFQSYIKEIDEIRKELPQESESPALAPATAYVSTSVDDCWDVPEKFQPTQEKKWRKDLRQDRRRDSKHVVEYYKQVRDGIAPAPEVPRAEYFNANKPPRVLRYESAQKRKTKMRQDQRAYSSGWGKQQLE